MARLMTRREFKVIFFIFFIPILAVGIGLILGGSLDFTQ